MKARDLIFFVLFFIIPAGCRQNSADRIKVLPEIAEALDSGNFLRVKFLADSVKNCCSEDMELMAKADSFVQIADRIALDFSVNEDQVNRQLKERIGDFKPEEKIAWDGRAAGKFHLKVKISMTGVRFTMREPAGCLLIYHTGFSIPAIRKSGISLFQVLIHTG